MALLKRPFSARSGQLCAAGMQRPACSAPQRFGREVAAREFPPLRRVRAAGRVVAMDAAFHINLVPLYSDLPGHFSLSDKILLRLLGLAAVGGVIRHDVPGINQ